MYSSINFKFKKQFKEAVAAGQRITVFQPGRIFNPPEASPTYSGQAFVEGPHFPKLHTWYATVTIKDGLVVKVK